MSDLGLVEHKVRVGSAAAWVLAGETGVEVAPLVKQVLTKAGLANRFEELFRDDGVGVDVFPVHGGHQALVYGEFLHLLFQTNLRTSTK